MSELVFTTSSKPYSTMHDSTGWSAQSIEAEHSDSHVLLHDKDNNVLARCSLWWRDTPLLEGKKIGAIGHYAATAAGHSEELLKVATRELRNQGCKIAVGPLDGNTWRRYRAVVEQGDLPPYFLEPTNPDTWPAYLERSGFAQLSHYVSEINPDIVHRQPQLGSLRDKFRKQGVTISPLQSENVDAELTGIYEVVRKSFADSFLYTPLELTDYKALYAPLIRQVQPELVLLARRNNEVIGFIFAVPDLLQARDPAQIDTIVIKTVAVNPDPRNSGLGRVLIVDLVENAIAAGYRQAISALMQVTNRSQQISKDCAGPMRRYALYAKDLAA